MNPFTWAIAILGSLSVGALIALAIFFPAVLSIVWQAIAKLFWRIVETRIGCAVLAAIVAAVIASLYQQHVDNKKFDKRTAEFREQQKKRDADIAKDAELFVRKQIADEFIAEQDAKNDLAEFKGALDPARVCLVGADAPKLQALWRVNGANNKRVRKTAQQGRDAAKR